MLTHRLTYLLFLVFILAPSMVFAQQYESLQQIKQLAEEGSISVDQAAIAHFEYFENGQIHKCATPAHMYLHQNLKALKPETIQLLMSSVSSASARASSEYLSPSGDFVIRYETSGVDAVPSQDENNNGVPDYVEEIGLAADSSYRHHIRLGFSDIFSVKSRPFPIEVANNSGVYGFVPAGAPFIGIENDFAGFPPNDDPDGDVLGAVRVTIAHELKHVVQFVDNNFSGDSDLWAEMDATLMEELVYDPVNDYYNYLTGFGDSIFEEPYSTLIPGSYEDISFALHFAEKYGNDFWPNVWIDIKQNPSLSFLNALRNEIERRDDLYGAAIAEAYMWHYAAGIINSPPDFGFEERFEYPVSGAFVERTYSSLPDTLSSSFNLTRYSADFMEVDLDEPRAGFASIQLDYSNPFIQLGLLAYFENGTTDSRFLEAQSSGQTRILTNWEWNDLDKLALVVVNTDPTASQSYQIRITSDLPARARLAQNYPNPFNSGTTLPFDLTKKQNVTLEVYNYLGRKIQTVFSGELDAGTYRLPFDGLSLASGIYLYRLQTEEGVFYKKMSLIK